MAAVAALTLAACASPGPFDMMPAPGVYEGGAVDPFVGIERIEDLPSGIFYATFREPEEAPSEPPYYANSRGDVLRVGVARFRIGESGTTWEEARRISLLKDRADTYPIAVEGVTEYGIVDSSLHPFVDPDTARTAMTDGDPAFAEAIREKLDRSERADLYVYVHGYKVTFPNPVLVGAELWHFLGYDGAFVAFSWPATPRTLAYLADLETTPLAAQELRLLLRYLAHGTNPRRIHILGYSAGTRVVVRALQELALQRSGGDDRPPPIGQVVLVGSDIERAAFVGAIQDGLLGTADHFTIYVSGRDDALAMSRRLFERERLGEMFAVDTMRPSARRFLQATHRVSVVNVTETEGSSSGNGHRYFRQSPWASSDILSVLRFDIPPAGRGLVREPATGTWSFPPDYLERHRRALERLDPRLTRGHGRDGASESGAR